MGISLLLLAAVAVLTALGQVLVKRGALLLDTRRGPVKLVFSFFNGPLMAGAAAVLIAPLLYFSALKKVPLLYAYSFSALTYPLVLLGARVFLKEKLNRRQWLGLAAVCAGLMVWNL